ncbi:MAG TPA: ABC transporter ATP-binding protein [Steroidobacteraceae bacterium]
MDFLLRPDHFRYVTNQRYAIETHGLTRRFGARTVLQPTNLVVPEGGIYGFLGPNGAGKTTTIRLLLGLIRPDAGSIQILGEPFEHGLLGRIGSLVEMPSLYAHLTGRENLEVTRRQIGARRASIDRVLGIVGLLGDARRLVREYSLGMKQRLGLALALLNSPDLLILDEPTNGLDPAGIHEMRDLLRRMPSEHGVTVFLSSHLLGEVEQIADFVGIIREGRIVFQGPLALLREGQSSRLIVGVHEREQALQFLKAHGFDAQSDGPAFIRVVGHELDANAINGLLVESGYKVFHVSLEQASLEGIFLSLTAD